MPPNHAPTAIMARRLTSRAPDQLDYFPTPPWATRALLEYVLLGELEVAAEFDGAWEPACGEMHMARPLAEYFAHVTASDCHDYGWPDGAASVYDFLFPAPPPVAAPEWIITNPPYVLAEQFLHRALEKATGGVALLCRSAWSEGQERYHSIFARRPPTLIAQFSERVAMVRDRLDPEASSATAYSWFVWRQPVSAHTGYVWIPPCRALLERPGDYPPAQLRPCPLLEGMV
jgi:hypothetical protein